MLQINSDQTSYKTILFKNVSLIYMCVTFFNYLLYSKRFSIPQLVSIATGSHRCLGQSRQHLTLQCLTFQAHELESTMRQLSSTWQSGLSYYKDKRWIVIALLSEWTLKAKGYHTAKIKINHHKLMHL